MVNYLVEHIRLFLINIAFINNLFNEFFKLIHRKLLANDNYEDYYCNFIKFLEKQKDFFYMEIYEYDGDYENLIIEITNILW